MIWAKALWITVGGKNFPPFLLGVQMKELSVFIDESGDFGEIKERPAYYIVTMVFHDQSNSIYDEIKKINDSISVSGFDIEYIHTGPSIILQSLPPA